MSDTDRTEPDGDTIAVRVTAPDGIPAPASVTIAYRPETTDDFERIVEALGGSLAFMVVSDFAFTHLPGGVQVHVHEPNDATPLRVQPHPFMRAFEKRIDDTKAFRDQLERAA